MKNNKILFFIIIFIILFIFSTFRNGLGTDYYYYANIYNNLDTSHTEFLFKLLFVTIPRVISKNAIIFFALTSFIINYFFLKTIFRYSQIVPLAIIIYITQFYFNSFNIVRQFIAISLFLYYGIKILNEKRIVIYFIFIFLLAQIHYSMYFMIIFPFLGSHNFKKSIYWFIWIASFIIFFTQSYNIVNISKIFSSTAKLNFLSDKFNFVSDASNYFYGTFTTNIQLIIKNILCVVFILRIKYFKNNKNIYWLNLFLFGAVLHNILFKYSLYAVRIGYYGEVALLILIPLFINSFKEKKYRIILLILFVIFFSFSFYYRFIINGESEVFKRFN